MANRQPISTFLSIAAAAVLVANGRAATINVPGDQPTIQAGINIANPGDVVIVAQGEYFENINFNGKAITVRSTDPNDAGVVLNTIINGGGLGSVVTCDSGEEADTVLSGFVITGGNATDGGGMFNNDSSPTVTNCSFSGNTAIQSGGGMRNDNGSSPTVTNCSFSANTSGFFGGGMSNQSSSNPTVINCSFIGNHANSGGGMSHFFSSPIVSNCTFSGNSAATSGGGMLTGTNSNAIVSNCTFSGNTAGISSGGMLTGNGSKSIVTNCTFSGNTAVFNGGGMGNQQFSNPTVTNCSFSGNSANAGGGMFNTVSRPTVTNTGFCDNTPDPIFGPFTDGGGNSLLYCPPPPLPEPDPCPTDINDDGVTNVRDLIQLLLAFGTTCP